MTLDDLESLVRTGKLKREPCLLVEFQALVDSGTARLADATNHELSLEGRFDLVYNASHALALAALRWHGFRTSNR